MTSEWLERIERAGCLPDCPIRMRDEWADEGAACGRCGSPVVPGELFLLDARCPMGGAVPLTGAAALYPETLLVEPVHVRCAAAESSEAERRCWTIGHGARPLQTFVEILRAHRIELLADVRTVPRSRHNPQYEQAALREGLQSAGVCYLHLPGLGGLRKPRADSPNAGWRNESFRGYADYMQTPAFDAALQELVDLLIVRRTAIMCAESVYWRCHRSLVADALTARGIPVLHLMGETTAEEVAHRLTRFASVEGTRVLYPLEP